jgi:hypothetical protein
MILDFYRKIKLYKSISVKKLQILVNCKTYIQWCMRIKIQAEVF